MKGKLIIFGLFTTLFSLSYSFAAEGEHSDHPTGSMKGSMTEQHSSQILGDVVEVGNKICPVSGQDVASMGGGIEYEHEGKIYNLCCKMCVKDFKKNPEKYSKIAQEKVSNDEQEGSHMEHKENKDGHNTHEHGH